MKAFIVDTNALLSFVTDRNPKQQMKVASLFEKAAEMDCKILCHVHVITEFVYLLEKVYGQKKTAIREMVTDLINMPGVDLIHHIDFKVLFDFWPGTVTDFGDAVVASVWSENRRATVVTFDHRFTKELKQIGALI